MGFKILDSRYKNIRILIIWILIIYLLGCFVSTSFNIKEWDFATRWFAAILVFFLCQSFHKVLNEK